jgi:hypothetical protein
MATTPATLNELMAMPDEELIQRVLIQIPRSPEHTKLTSILQMRWSMRNQKSAEENAKLSEENAKLTAELVKQTTALAKETKELADQTRYMATATFRDRSTDPHWVGR